MTGESFEVVPVAYVVGGPDEPTDDYWGGTRSIIRIDGDCFTTAATVGLDEFSHIEVVFRFHLTDPTVTPRLRLGRIGAQTMDERPW